MFTIHFVCLDWIEMLVTLNCFVIINVAMAASTHCTNNC